MTRVPSHRHLLAQRRRGGCKGEKTTGELKGSESDALGTMGQSRVYTFDREQAFGRPREGIVRDR